MDAAEGPWPGPRVADAIFDAKEHRAAQPPIAVTNLVAGLHVKIKALVAPPLLASLVARSPGRQSRGRLACSRDGSGQAARTRRALAGTPSPPCSGPNAGFPPGHALTLRSERPRLARPVARPIGSGPPPNHWSPLSEIAHDAYPDGMPHYRAAETRGRTAASCLC
eukprot:scaffold25998_cov63-Phaeocystis_antarctica.AAC.1